MSRHMLVLIAFCVILAACGHNEFSDLLTEPAVVDRLLYTPARHTTGVGVGVGSKGAIPVVTVSNEPAFYGVLFRCQHGNFIVRSKRLWTALREGAAVRVSYRERVWVGRHGERTPNGFRFENAEVVP